MDHYRTERQRQAIADRFAFKLLAIVEANHQHPRRADIEAVLERARALRSAATQ
jgi:hypothetical protein